MNIETRKESAAMIVELNGRLDAVSSPAYEQKLNALIADGETKFVVDFEQLDYISSAGLRALLASAKRVKGKSGQLLLANIVGPVKEVFAISGFASIFQVYQSVASALVAVAG
ncbi:MAG: STAS domain-containing protein [Chlorobiaceae bacterium]